MTFSIVLRFNWLIPGVFCVVVGFRTSSLIDGMSCVSTSLSVCWIVKKMKPKIRGKDPNFSVEKLLEEIGSRLVVFCFLSVNIIREFERCLWLKPNGLFPKATIHEAMLWTKNIQFSLGWGEGHKYLSGMKWVKRKLLQGRIRRERSRQKDSNRFKYLSDTFSKCLWKISRVVAPLRYLSLRGNYFV